MGWQANDIPAQAGRVAVVTGASSGLGLEAARELARRGAHVIMAVRDPAKGERVRGAILAQIPLAGLEVRQLDLSSLVSVRAFAVDAIRDRPHIDLLVNNAGVMATPPRQTDDGFEWQVGVNHLGHFALTAALLPALLRSHAARVVTVSSAVGLIGRSLRQERLAPGPSYHAWRAYGDSKLPLRCPGAELHAWRAYGDSKLAGYRFALELARRLALAGAPVASFAVHPGLADTDLQPASVRAGGAGPLGRVGMLAAQRFGMSASDGALSALRAATDPGARNGESYGPRWVMAGPPVRLPTLSPWLGREKLERLWAVSEAATGADYRAALAATPASAGHARLE